MTLTKKNLQVHINIKHDPSSVILIDTCCAYFLTVNKLSLSLSLSCDKTEIVRKLKNSNWDNSKTQIVIKLKKT